MPSRKKKIVDDQLIDEALRGWHTLNPMLPKLSRRQVARLLEAELQGSRRASIVKRLYQRLARVRANEEFKQLVAVKRHGRLEWLTRELRDG